MATTERTQKRERNDARARERAMARPPHRFLLLHRSRPKSKLAQSGDLRCGGPAGGWNLQRHSCPRGSGLDTLATAATQASTPSVRVTYPQAGQQIQKIDLPGNVQAFYDTPIYARTSGYMERWYVDIGAHVKQGQLMAEIETPELDQQLQQAQADLKTATRPTSTWPPSPPVAKRWQNLLAKKTPFPSQETDQAMSGSSPRGNPRFRRARPMFAGYNRCRGSRKLWRPSTASSRRATRTLARWSRLVQTPARRNCFILPRFIG